MAETPAVSIQARLGLKKIPPYWHPYTTMAKQRWLDREILEVVSTEFRDRSMEYYRYALESGVTTINGEVAKPDTVVRNGDRIENVVHRHEPPVTSKPINVLLRDVEREFIVVDKPGSIPVHASGRYYKNTLIEILKRDFGYDNVYAVNRLDRLTSGLMIIPLTSRCASALTDEFMKGTVRKEYIARCRGEFPSEEIVCEAPLLTVDRQMGLNIVHPEGKHAKTVFNRIRYDANTDTSVLHCQPLTGRSHQIRVHLQYLGYPIANDPIYSDVKIWGPSLGKNGIDLAPSEDRSRPTPPAHLIVESNPETPTLNSQEDDQGKRKALPRETGHDIGMGSPVPLSSEAVGIVTRLRNMKDESEDWSRWRDVVFRAKGRLTPHEFRRPPLPPQNKRKRGGPVLHDANGIESSGKALGNSTDVDISDAEHTTPDSEQVNQLQYTTEEALSTLSDMKSSETSDSISASASSQSLYCPECYLPLHPDPNPQKLYIFLHALRYTSSLGSFETEMPDWASEGWVSD